MKTYHANTMTQLHADMCHDIVHAPDHELDVISTVDVQIHNVMAQADSMDWDFDLKDMWLTPQRWSMMINQYIDPEAFGIWLDQCGKKIGTRGRGIAMMRTKTVAARGGPAQGNKETRRWGSCMLAISYKAKPRPQITLYSRTSYLGYLGALDLSVAWMCARYVAQALGIDVEDIQFVWMNEAVQFHNFKSMAYLLNHPDKKLRKKYRKFLMKRKLKPEFQAEMSTTALDMTRVWLQKLIREDRECKTLGDMTYNTYRRIRRRFHTEVMGYDYAKQFEGWSHYKVATKDHEVGDEKEFFKAYQPLPHTYIKNLDFQRLGYPLAGVAKVDYDGEYDEETEEDDD